MRELKREEYGMIAGGIDTTTLHAVQVNGPGAGGNSGYGLYDSFGFGNTMMNMGAGHAGDGGSATVTFGPNGNITSATIHCSAGTNPSVASGGGNIHGGAGAVGKFINATVGVSGGGGTLACHR